MTENTGESSLAWIVPSMPKCVFSECLLELFPVIWYSFGCIYLLLNCAFNTFANNTFIDNINLNCGRAKVVAILAL